jgi:hypothetical protein
MATIVTSVLAAGSRIAGGVGDLNAGQIIQLTLEMSAAVTVGGGVPTLSLNDLGVAVYDAAQSTSTALVFNYTVATGQNVSSLSVIEVNLNGATITDGASNNADLSTALDTFTGLQVDTIGPQVQNFTASDPPLTNANVVHYTLTFSEPVTGVNADDFSLATTGVSGASITSVTTVSGSDGAKYTITVDTGTGDGTIALHLAGAPVQDLAGNPLPGGTFTQTQNWNVANRVGSVAIGDLNGDGIPDFVVTNYSLNSVSVFLGKGNGAFYSPVAYPQPCERSNKPHLCSNQLIHRE